MQKIYLKGEISKFGEVWDANVKNLAEALKLIGCQAPGFRQYLIELTESNRMLEFVKGKEILTDIEDILIPIKDEDIIITEVPRGSEDAIDFFVAAVVVFYLGPEGLGLITSESLATSLAISLSLTGVQLMLAPGPETDIPDEFGAEEDMNAKLFNGPANTAKQGIPIPLLYGELMVGGATIYASLEIPDEVVAKNFARPQSSAIKFSGG